MTSDQPTCRSGFEVLGVMDGRVDLVLDAGAVAGPGATTIDWKMIRVGTVSESAINAALQP